MTSPTKEAHQFFDYYRPDGLRFGKHVKGLGDPSRRDRDDGKMLADTSAGLGRIRSDIDSRKDKKELFANPKRLSFADAVPGTKRLDRLERELDDASAQVEDLRQKNRSLRHQLNLANQEREQQSKDRDKAYSMWEKSRSDHKKLLNEIEVMKKENGLLQKRLDQNDYQADEDLASHLSDAVKQVQQLTKEKDEIQRRMLDEMEHLKDNLDEAINDRDAMKYQISELLREKEKLIDRVSAMTPGFEAAQSELDKVTEQRDLLKVQSKDLKRENQHLHSQLSNHSSPDQRGNLVELEALREQYSFLEQERDELLIKIEEIRSERQCSVTSTDDEGVGSMSEYRHDDDFRTKIAALEVERCSMEDRLETATRETNDLQTGLALAKEQIKHILREKGVALRESTATFEESVQLQSRVVELSAEKECAIEHRKVATKEKERVITENVALKNKLDAIMMQRQKDAKELGNMRRGKDQAYHELSEVRKHYRELKEKLKQSEYEMALLAETICSQLNIEKKGSVSSLLHRYIEQVQLEKDSFLSRLFDGRKYANISLSDACARLDAILHEKACLLIELERARKDVRSEKEKDKVTNLKEQINDLAFERDALQEQVDKMSSKIARHGAELKRCSIQIQLLQKEKAELKLSHEEVVEKHAKTLERVDEMWKSRPKPQIRWDEFWEERRVVLEMKAAGDAGFTVMGGRDQQQLPNPNAIIVTQINMDSPAYQHLIPGDVLESVNGVNLGNVDHQDAICAIRENKGLLNLVVRRCRNPMAFNSVVNGDPTDLSTEEHDFSLLIQKEGIGFKHQWTISYQVADILQGGPAHQILQVGDKITNVNGAEVSHVKNSVFKKMLKPQKGVLKLHIVRPVKDAKSDAHAIWAPDSFPHCRSDSTTKSYSRSSSEISNDIGPEAVVVDRENYRPTSRNSYGSRNSNNYTFPRNNSSSRDPTRDSGVSADRDSPPKGSLYSPRIHTEQPSQDEQYVMKAFDQQTSQDSIETGYSAMPTKLVLSSTESLCTGSSCSSQSSSRVTFAPGLKRNNVEYGDVDYDSNNCNNKMFAFTNSQTQSVNLSFHSQSFISHNQLTVETTQTLTGSDDDDAYNFAPFARDDVHRSTVRTRSMTSLTDNRNSNLLLSNGYQAESEFSQCSQVSQPHHGRLTTKRSLSIKSNRSATGMRESGSESGRRNSHSGSTVSSSTIASARSLSNLDDRKYSEYDPLCNATYLRANFSYIPRYRKELRVGIGDVFHIHDELPKHHKASFWVSRLHDDGTDADIGAIPNSPRANYYITEDQGEEMFGSVYTEVEPCRDSTPRPVLIFGVAIEPVIELLLEGYPDTFVSPIMDTIEASDKITRDVLDSDVESGKIISYTGCPDGGFTVLSLDMIKSASNKSTHCLLVGNMSTHLMLSQRLPPISIFIKAQAPESISTFDPAVKNPHMAMKKFREMEELEHEHGHYFSATLCLATLELLVGQIHDKVKDEQNKVTWVPVRRDY